MHDQVNIGMGNWMSMISPIGNLLMPDIGICCLEVSSERKLIRKVEIGEVVHHQLSEEIQTSMNTIKETVKDVSKLSNTLGLTSSERLAQLQELARTIGDEANQVSGHYQNMATQFNATLQAGNQQLAGYLQQANEVYSNRIQEFDTATATICQQLNSMPLVPCYSV